MMLLKKITMEGGRPWGFKIAGGAEVNKPIIITKVNISKHVTNFDLSYSLPHGPECPHTKKVILTLIGKFLENF